MPLVPLEQLLTHVDSKYRLVIIAAKRTKQLMRGAEHLIAPKSNKPTYIALEEIGAGRLAYEMKPVEGTGAVELIGPEAGATWFRSLSVGDTLGEEEIVEKEEEEKEGAELEEPPVELLAESGEEIEKLEVTDLDALEEPAEVEDEA
ncbi:DNA-directed RNA polymerase subunit omega [Candidatus Methylomirabilis sp.]|uniref:DNA-directed RNA polymerase subunit omega n=1 Tax=Candidatus Methylomirabilis sp. TaxID=2032687 RepID=UPI002A64B7EC|nr:DNA-directed RNA polymerase subunit omega [Candidatus Methylomirabilis sp.]